MNFLSSHRFSSKHRTSIFKSQKCGCFHCLMIFSPKEIVDWCDDDEKGIGQTAVCPYCGVDAVLGDYDLKFDKVLLKKMNKSWF